MVRTSPNRSSRRALQSVSVVVAVLFGFSACTHGPERVERSSASSDLNFDVETLLALSDADMAGYAYADGKLRPVPGQKDRLRKVDVESLKPRGEGTVASNAVTSWPGSMVVGPEGEYAYVAEVRGPLPDDVEEVESAYTSFPEGKTLQTVDIRGRLDTVDRTEIGGNPRSVDVSPDGQWLALATDREKSELVFVGLEGGTPANVTRVHYDTTGYETENFGQGLQFATVAPDGTRLAVHLGNTHVAFLEVAFDGEGAPSGVEPIGDPVEVGEWISMGEWSNNGEYYLVADTAWGPKNIDAAKNGPGSIVVVEPTSNGAHRIASRAEVSLSPESFALNRRGNLLVSVNMERTYLPSGFLYSFFGRKKRSSLSLLSFDRDTGRLDHLDGPVSFRGVLPENAVFDRDGDAIAVAVFHERSQQPKNGWIRYFEVEGSEGDRRVTPTDRKTQLTRGVHDLAAVY